MKSVLISIQPKWCELIASGEKTIEMRKTAQKEREPFKVYIYQTQRKWIYRLLKRLGLYRGKVIGEFVCDYIVPFRIACEMSVNVEAFQQSALSWEELIKYAGDNPYIYGWHISDLKIYDTPKELGEFFIPCKVSCAACKKPAYFESGCSEKGRKSITRPPQSWCYVEEIR